MADIHGLFWQFNLKLQYLTKKIRLQPQPLYYHSTFDNVIPLVTLMSCPRPSGQPRPCWWRPRRQPYRTRARDLFYWQGVRWYCHLGNLSALMGHCLLTHWSPLQWRHNERDGVLDHQPHDCLLKRLIRRRSKKTSKPRVTGPCAGNSPGTGEFPAKRASNVENVSIWWRHHVNIWRSHGMKTPSALLVICEGNPVPATGGFTSQAEQ